MATVDLVFEGGGAKGIAFVGALQTLLGDGAAPGSHVSGRLLGTSAGAITATLLAAGYGPQELLDALVEQADNRSVFSTFLERPALGQVDDLLRGTLGDLLKQINLPLVPPAQEQRLYRALLRWAARHPRFPHLISLLDRGGWFAADAFVAWLRRRLDTAAPDGQPRVYSNLTLRQFFKATGRDLTVIASDTTARRMLILNHVTAPDCPLVAAVRMSMSLPLVWPEVVWQTKWGFYRGRSLAGHLIIDGGVLSNFPLALFLSRAPSTYAIMGQPHTANVIGLLIDEELPVPNAPPPPTPPSPLADLPPVERAQRWLDTAIQGRDNAAIDAFAAHVVRLPAQGYGTVEFDMSKARREALLAAGRRAMADFLVANQPPPSFAPTLPDVASSAAGMPALTNIEAANRAARAILSP